MRTTPWLRIAGGLATFAIVALMGIAGLASFDAGQATTSWALVTVVALPAGLAAYAIIEYLQTGRLDSMSRQFDTRTIVLMPLAIALNIALGQAVGTVLRLPIYLDSIGTILVGVLAGPLAGAITGLLSNLAWTYLAPPPFANATTAPFALTATVIGLLAGAFAAWGWMRPRPDSPSEMVSLAAVVVVENILILAVLAYIGYRAIFGEGNVLPAEGSDVILGALAVLGLGVVVLTIVGVIYLLVRRRDRTIAYVVLAGVITGLCAAVIAAPIAASVYGGVAGSGTDFLVAAFRQAGADLYAATLGQSLISDPIDKVVTFVVVYLVLGAMSVRARARFPQGDRLIPASSSDQEATD